jgi:proteic killer suppression protein
MTSERAAYHVTIQNSCILPAYRAMIRILECMMIVSFKDKTDEAVAIGKAPKGFPADLVRSAQRKLCMIEHASELRDLRSLPGNRLEALKGDRAGQHSIRINDQWRVCFVWKNDGAHEVEIADYH